MDREKRKNLIGSMLLYCLAGDLAIRANYGGILISRIENYLVEEVVLKDPNHSYLTSIVVMVDTIIEAALIGKDAKNPEQLKEFVATYAFPIDPTWAEAEAMKSLAAISDLSGIRLSRKYYYDSLDASTQSGKDAMKYSEAIKNMDRAMQYIVDICDRYDLAGFGGNEWRENITSSNKEG